MIKAGEAEKLAYLAKNHEKRLLHELEKLNIKYKLGLINKDNYEYTLNHLLRGRSTQDWLNYYKIYKEKCFKIIDEENKDRWFRNFLLILLCLALLLPLSLQYTGFSVAQDKIVFIGKTVSTSAYLLVDGVAQPIPLKPEPENDYYVYKITYLKFSTTVKHIDIMDNGNLVFSKDLA